MISDQRLASNTWSANLPVKSKPDHGWYLTGPGIKKPVFLAQRKTEAVEAANEIVSSHDHKRRSKAW